MENIDDIGEPFDTMYIRENFDKLPSNKLLNRITKIGREVGATRIEIMFDMLKTLFEKLKEDDD